MVRSAGVGLVVVLVVVGRSERRCGERRREQSDEGEEQELLHGGFRMAQEPIDAKPESVEESRKERILGLP